MEVDETPAVGWTRSGAPYVPSASLDARRPAGLADWRGDVALELWVETDADPVRIRMAGRLDASTAANLDDVVCELLDDGNRRFELCTDGLRVVDTSAIGALADVERRIRTAGGTMWRVAPRNGPFARTAKGPPPPPAVR